MRTYKESYDQNGIEIPDTTPAAMPVHGFEAVSSMDEKMKAMFEKYMTDDQVETIEDDLDFDVDTGEIYTKHNNFTTKKEAHELKKQSQLRKKKRSEELSRKSTPMDNDGHSRPVEQKKKHNSKIADASPSKAAIEED